MNIFNNELVSVLIPAYNVEKYVGRAIESALGQTYKNIEVIVVDDGSSDKTAEIIKEYAEKDKRVKYVYQENKRLAGARNTGIKNANGKYLAFLDADDIFLPQKIEKQAEYMQANPNCDFCYCDLWLFYENKPDELVETKYKFYSGKDVLPALIKLSFINTLTVMIRKDVVERFGYLDERYTHAEDLEYFLRLAYMGANFCFFDKKLAKFCIRQNGAHQSGFEGDIKNKLAIIQIYEELYKKMSPEERRTYNMRRHIGTWQIKCALVYFINKDKKTASQYLRKSMFFYPPISSIALFLFIFYIIPIKFTSKIILKLQVLRRLLYLKHAR